MNQLPTNVVIQVGIIVRDIERTARAYAGLFGMEMPAVSLTGTVEEAHTRYRGESTTARAKLAFFQMGGITLELIEPVGGPSTWQEFLDTHGEGAHHIALHFPGMDEAIDLLAAKGIPAVQRGDYPGGRYAYLDSAPQLAVLLELLEDVPSR